MKLNNFMFKEELAYTYGEVLQHYNGVVILMTKNELASLIGKLGTIVVNSAGTLIINNTLSYSFLSAGDPQEKVSKNAVDVVNKLWARYKDHYAVVVSSEDEFANACKNFFTILFNVLDYTFVKYDTLLNMYESQKSHLLDKLARIRHEDKSTESEVSSTSSSNSKSASSDTPQTINVSQDYGNIAGYFNNYDQAGDEAESHSEGANEETNEITESFDPMTIMARIEEVQQQFENTMFKWVEEFDRLFIEEGNI